MSTMIKRTAQNLVEVSWSLLVTTTLLIAMGIMAASAMGENAANSKAVNLREEAVKPKKRSEHRVAKKSREGKNARRAARKQRLSSSENAGNKTKPKPASPVTLRLQGSFELNLGEGKSMRGKGDVTIELDQATLDMLQTELDKKWNDVLPVVKDLSQTVARMPDMLATTERILMRLTDPATLKIMERAAPLLKLLENLPSGQNSKKKSAQKSEQ